MAASNASAVFDEDDYDMDNCVRNAVIESARLSTEDHGSLIGYIQLDRGDGSQCFGGMALYMGPKCKHHRLETPAGHWIWRVMEIAGVTDWARLPGKTVRIKVRDGRIVAIGHIVKNDWFCPKQDFAGLA